MYSRASVPWGAFCPEFNLALWASIASGILGKLTLNVYELLFYRCAETNDDLVDDDDDLEKHIWEHRAIYMHSFEIFTSVLKLLF
ncbi:hypothetical protein HF325_005905 [Metschnikowia pulcherrima]|uniref:Uncharacterized protein n=1 Tax=Metschnikowia pulcherrima TaxID=27326 RepID=A0A8H7L7Z2_9ASCO|nr:hypothetical protein HF325_005905 [Metschnikowia pulcherrima]